jgi:hypothetical protein
MLFGRQQPQQQWQHSFVEVRPPMKPMWTALMQACNDGKYEDAIWWCEWVTQEEVQLESPTDGQDTPKQFQFEAARKDQLGARAQVSDAGGVVFGTIRAIPAHKLDHRVNAPGYH